MNGVRGLDMLDGVLGVYSWHGMGLFVAPEIHSLSLDS